jgi:RNA polymerase sigma-70 factor (ECF subfamily)
MNLQESTPDEALMAALLRREPPALRELYSRYQGLLHTVAMNVVHDPLDAEEVLQDVFLHIWNRAEAYSSEKGKPLSWLVMLVRRRSIDRLRQQSSYRRATTRFEEVCLQDHATSRRSAEADRKTSLDDLRALLRRQMHRLPPAQKQAVEMTFFSGMSQREIASVTSLPLGTVKTRIELGLRKLSHLLLTARMEMGVGLSLGT